MIRVVACGKIKEKWMRMGIEEYAKRIEPYEKLECVEVDDEKTPDHASEADNLRIKKIEGERILKRIKPEEFVILLDLKGKEIDSVKLAETIETIHVKGYHKITFVIGGSLGVSDELIQRANMRWMISRNTFPHQLCRIIVLEQIYRAFRIQRNEPYHK